MDEKPPLLPPNGDEEELRAMGVDPEGYALAGEDEGPELDLEGDELSGEPDTIGTSAEPDEALEPPPRRKGSSGPPPAKTIEEQRRELEEEARAKGEHPSIGSRRRGRPPSPRYFA